MMSLGGRGYLETGMNLFIYYFFSNNESWVISRFCLPQHLTHFKKLSHGLGFPGSREILLLSSNTSFDSVLCQTISF